MAELLHETIPAPADANPAARLECFEGREEVVGALEQLSADDRLILFLRYEQDMTGHEIASALGVTHGAARQRIFRALRRLQDLLQAESSGEGGDS